MEAIGELGIPIILPYGNMDARYKEQIRSVNLLSLASNARVYSGVDQQGNPNTLTRDIGTSDLGQGNTAHSALVEVELA